MPIAPFTEQFRNAAAALQGQPLDEAGFLLLAQTVHDLIATAEPTDDALATLVAIHHFLRNVAQPDVTAEARLRGLADIARITLVRHGLHDLSVTDVCDMGARSLGILRHLQEAGPQNARQIQDFFGEGATYVHGAMANFATAGYAQKNAATREWSLTKPGAVALSIRGLFDPATTQ